MKPIAKKPPMGWNSWDCYGASVTEAEVKANADYMAKNLKEYGWEYVVVDIEWFQPTVTSEQYIPGAELVMDEYARLMPAENRFPSAAKGNGFKQLGDYIHSLGLKFGIHILRGIPKQAVRQNTKIKGTNHTAAEIVDIGSICEWNPDMAGVDMSRDGAQEYYNSIFELYADWGVDFVKVDDIARPYHKAEVQAINKAIANTGRNMVLSLSPGIAPIADAEHFCEYANMWRMTDDFWDRWELLKKMFDFCRDWFPYVGEGSWPDCDMLPLGRIGIRSAGGDRMTNFTHDEQKLMVSLWAMFRSPLMFGGDMIYNDEFTLSLMQNRELLNINQNSYAGRELYRKGNEIVWAADSENCSYMAVFNIGDTSLSTTVNLSFMGKASYTAAKEIWSNENTEIKNNTVSANVNAHGVKLYKLT